MSLFINPKRTVRFVLEGERGLDPSLRHTFLLKTLSCKEYTERYDRSRDHFEGDFPRLNLGAWQRWTLFYGLVGAEGPGSYPIPFVVDPATDHVSDAFLDSLHPTTRKDLAVEIDRLSKLAHDDPKD